MNPAKSMWTHAVTRVRALRFDTVRAKLLAFALLATLAPIITTAVVSHRRNRHLLEDRLALELRSASAEAAREAGAWLDQQASDLRLRAGSYVLAENLARLDQRSERTQALTRLRDFINSIRERSPDHEALAILDLRGRVVTTTSGRTGRFPISLDQLGGLRTGDVLVGDAFWDPTLGKAVMLVAAPIRAADGRFVGALLAKTGLASLGDALRRLAPRGPGDVFLMTEAGAMVLTARSSSAELMRRHVPDSVTRALLDGDGRPARYARPDGKEVIGVPRRVPQLGWAAVAEVPRGAGFGDLAPPRSISVLTVLLLLAGVGLVGYVVVITVARPLERLTRAAAIVAAGDLSVDLPASGSGELGYLTRVFNTLVARLRQRESQGELERLSVTDDLTGLSNRRHLMNTLANEVQRSRRQRRSFAVLLADVDRFKPYNDTHGHLAGDAALARIADILRKTTRGVDCVSRYGGEEFVMMLLETTVTAAIAVSERIRTRVAAEPFEGGRLTLSIGVAEFPAHGETPDELIASADAAMYQAKNAGRDRVGVASGPADPPAASEKPRRRKSEV